MTVADLAVLALGVPTMLAGLLIVACAADRPRLTRERAEAAQYRQKAAEHAQRAAHRPTTTRPADPHPARTAAPVPSSPLIHDQGAEAA